MIVQKKVREIYNLQCLEGPQDLAFGIKITPITKEIDQAIRQTGCGGNRWAGLSTWIIEGEKTYDTELLTDSDMAKGLRILPAVLLLSVSPRLKFGPEFFVHSDGEIPGILFDDYAYPHMDRLHCMPTDFIVDHHTIDLVRANLIKMVAHIDAPILTIPVRRFTRACLDKLQDDAIVDIWIAIESIFMSNSVEDIASKCASFLADDEVSRRDIYLDMWVLGRGRNMIMHQGTESPIIALKDGRTFGVREIADKGFLLLSSVLRKILADITLVTLHKRDVSRKMGKDSEMFKAEFAVIKKNYIPD